MQTTTSFTPSLPSRRARFARTATRLTLRPLTDVMPDNALGIALGRRVLALFMAGAGQSATGVRVDEVESSWGGSTVTGEWVRPQDARRDGVILYIHGSGYALCSTRTHRKLVSQLAKRTGLTVFSAEYRLAPEHPFPAAPEDVVRAYDWLLSQGWRADQVLVAGDSAGGHLTLDLAVQLLRDGRELPAGLLMMSPLADPSCELIEQREQICPDAMISAAGVRKLFRHYLLDTDPKHPRLTHVLVDGEVLPPTLIQAGGAEFLAADAHHLHDMLAATGTDVRLEVWPGQMHVFQAAPRVIPEAHRALDRAAAHLVAALEAAAAEHGSARSTSTREDTA